MVDMVDVAVWWGRPEDERAWHATLLDPLEQQRRSALLRPADRARFTVATVLLKQAAGRRLALPAGQVTIDRTCADCGRPHGRPRLPGTGLAASISHSGDRVVVALTSGPPVGVDVEELGSVDVAAMASQVLAPGEAATTRAEFYRYWTRKEAIVKATGDGLRAPLTLVEVTPPDQPPALLRYPDRVDLRASMADLDPGEGFMATVAVLTDAPIRVHPHAAADLLTTAP